MSLFCVTLMLNSNSIAKVKEGPKKPSCII
uniref:Uncharacterized protein n=1 Tax=Rhizophora mucronata TaxID=61149 RepID=A0A2P2QF47_RHIMU